MVRHIESNAKMIRSMIRKGEIQYAGNLTLKIYGLLHCKSGKKMKDQNRVFFSDAKEAIAAGYRPCGHCMKAEYRIWKGDKIRKGH